MSDNVLSYGFMVPLITAIPKGSDEWDDAYEYLDKFGLHLNYEGSIVYSDKRDDAYGGIYFPSRGDLPEFLENVKKANLIVNGSQVSPYVCLWYNGTDSYMSELTLAAFKEKTT